ncbi:hypothetical protein AVEN_217388-1 [Araneus ventricosus]|uniref:Uncharacterized protein n=1 Tax=Araneus ventricosus TaxID=182803 RepID=A0A4Y2HZ84_ARAVE|nr:hypothetical protein AVEN_217388-1 [Araneus ventricosus]
MLSPFLLPPFSFPLLQIPGMKRHTASHPHKAEETLTMDGSLVPEFRLISSFFQVHWWYFIRLEDRGPLRPRASSEFPTLCVYYVGAYSTLWENSVRAFIVI